jgi:hypothetical protein
MRGRQAAASACAPPAGHGGEMWVEQAADGDDQELVHPQAPALAVARVCLA